MKKLIILLLSLQINFIFAQDPIILDMASAERVDNIYKDGTYYIKDINGYLNDFVGTWSYMDGSYELRITFEKTDMYHHYYEFGNYITDYYSDGLYLSYQKIENGIITFSSPQYGIPPFTSIQEFGKLFNAFIDFERNDSTFPATFTLQPNGNNEYDLFMDINTYDRRNTYYEEHPDEPFLSIPNEIVLIKM